MRRWLLVLVPLLLLVALVALLRASANWRVVPSAAAGELMYAAAFDGFLDEWQQYDDGQVAAQAQDGAFRLTLRELDKFPFSLARPTFGDFDLRVTARAVEGPTAGYGVMFRRQTPAAQRSVTWGDLINQQLERLFPAPGVDAFYLFLVSADGYYKVTRFVDGEEQLISQWILSDIVHQGFDQPNHLRVVASGSRFQFYVNGTRVPLCIPDDPEGISTTMTIDGVLHCIQGTMQETLVDATVATGQIGLVAQTFDEPAVIEFDNLLIYGPPALAD